MSTAIYEAYRRSTEYDQPRPAQIGHEWVLTQQWRTLALKWPDTVEGQCAAEETARCLNQAFRDGQESARHMMRCTLGLEDEE